MCNALGPMAQDIPEQDIVMGEQELPPQMDPKPKMAAVCDTSPSPPHQNPPPIPAESAQPSTAAMAQIVAILSGMENRMGNNMKEEMNGNARQMENRMEANLKENAKQMKNEMDGMAQTIREEMQCMGAGLLDGLDKLKIGNGELRRATCWGRLVEVTEEVTVTETCTRETRHVEVTECTETREMTRIEERLHGVKDAHTHTHR